VPQKLGGNDPEWLKNRVGIVMANDRAQMEGVLPTYARLLSDPKSWSNPYLSRYYDGPNASQVSFKGGPWSAVGATNRSKEWGGEDLADDVFEYYKSIARPGQLGGVVGALSENPYAKAVTFNDQQAYFTPYDYAIHGVTPSGSLRTEISALDPRFWQTQGNLQQLPDGTWGFITGTNPYAGGSNPTQTLDPENVALQYKYNKSGGMFGGGFGGLLGKAMSFVNPWLGVPGMVAAGASMLDKDKPNAPSSTGFQPTVAPQWNPSPAPRSSGLPAAVADNSRYRVPQPGDLDYPDYLRTLASGREWYRYE